MSRFFPLLGLALALTLSTACGSQANDSEQTKAPAANASNAETDTNSDAAANQARSGADDPARDAGLDRDPELDSNSTQDNGNSGTSSQSEATPADAATTGSNSQENAADSGSTSPEPCGRVTVEFEASILTVAGTPFGLANAIDRERLATGNFTYDRCVPDTDPLDDAEQGVFDHDATQQGAFSLQLAPPNGEQTVELQVTGSTAPLLRIRGLDYFDYADGGFDTVNEVPRYITINGVQDDEAQINFSIGEGPQDFASDELPEHFPYLAEQASAFDCFEPEDYCVTFTIVASIKHSFLLQLHTLRQAP